jgi:hypothetical protein
MNADTTNLFLMNAETTDFLVMNTDMSCS